MSATPLMFVAPPHAGNQSVTIHKSCSADSEVAESLRRGVRVYVVESREDGGEKRAHVKLADEETPLGWLSAALISYVFGAVFVLALPRLVRRSVELSSLIVGTLPAGTRCHIVKTQRTSAGAHRVAVVLVGRNKVLGWLSARTDKGVLCIREDAFDAVGNGEDGVPEEREPLFPCSATPRRPATARSVDSEGFPYSTAFLSSSGGAFISQSGSSSSAGRHAQARQTPQRTPRTPREPKTPRTPKAPREPSSFAQPKARASDTGEQDSSMRPVTSKVKARESTNLMSASRLQEIATTFQEKATLESAKLGAGDKALSVRLGEHFLEKKIKTNELVAKCALVSVN